MFWGNIQSASKPTDRPSVESKTGEYILIAQGSKDLVLLNEWQAVEYALPFLHQFILVKVKPFKDILSFILWMQN